MQDENLRNRRAHKPSSLCLEKGITAQWYERHGYSVAKTLHKEDFLFHPTPCAFLYPSVFACVRGWAISYDIRMGRGVCQSTSHSMKLDVDGCQQIEQLPSTDPLTVVDRPVDGRQHPIMRK